MYMKVHRVQIETHGGKMLLESLELELQMDDCELSYGPWELYQDPLEEQLVLFKTESTLQAPWLFICIQNWRFDVLSF